MKPTGIVFCLLSKDTSGGCKSKDQMLGFLTYTSNTIFPTSQRESQAHYILVLKQVSSHTFSILSPIIYPVTLSQREREGERECVCVCVCVFRGLYAYSTCEYMQCMEEACVCVFRGLCVYNICAYVQCTEQACVYECVYLFIGLCV